MVRRIKKLAKKIGRVGRAAFGIAKPTIRNAAKQIIPQMTKSLIDKAVAAAMFAPAPLRGLPRGARMTNAPAAFGSTVRTPEANIRTGRGTSRIAHSEYIGDVATRDAGTFDLQFIFGLNPGNSALFPWASKIAQQYDSYRFNSLTFRYMPLCGTQTQGVVVMAIDYDASDAPPMSLQQMLTYKGAVQTNAWKPVANVSALSDLSKAKSHYVLSGVPPPNTDVKLYDVGNFYLAVNSVSAGGAIGQLFVDYDITFDTPQTELDPPSVGTRKQVSVTVTPTNLMPDVISGLIGPMGVYFDTSDGTTYNLYVPSPGYYTLYNVLSGPTDTIFVTSIESVQGTPLLNLFANAPALFTQFLQFQVVNPDQPALTWSAEVTGATTPADVDLYWSIQPIAADLATLPTYMAPPSNTDLRRRFGKTPKPV
jgi:hypothetical protein